MNKKLIYEKLKEFDQELIRLTLKCKIEIVIFGGSFFIMNDFINRKTRDIDVAQIKNKNDKKLVKFNKNVEKIANKYDINTKSIFILVDVLN